MLYEDSEFSQTVKIRLDQQVMDTAYYLQYLAGRFWKSCDLSGHVTIENEVLGYSAFRHIFYGIVKEETTLSIQQFVLVVTAELELNFSIS